MSTYGKVVQPSRQSTEVCRADASANDPALDQLEPRWTQKPSTHHWWKKGMEENTLKYLVNQYEVS